MSDAWNERLRLIRFRRKRERSTLREELRIIPKWLIGTCLVLGLVALFLALFINIHNFQTGDPIFPDDSYRNREFEANIWLAALVLLSSLMLSSLVLTLGYVYRDAKRRGMNSGLWTLLVLILSPAYLFIGLVIYLLIREPLPFNCPQCSSSVSARFNFCPSCKYNLHPACPQCQREVSDGDKFCPYCAAELGELKKEVIAPPGVESGTF